MCSARSKRRLRNGCSRTTRGCALGIRGAGTSDGPEDTAGGQNRAEAKLALTRRLYRVGYDREQMMRLYQFLDWLLRLPTEVAAAVWQTIRAYKGEQAWCGGRGLMVHPPPGARMAAILRLT